MIFLDSWVWLEYVFEGDKWRDAEAAIERANTADAGGIVAATVVAEVSYRIRRARDAETASEAIEAIRAMDHVEVLPVTDEIAEFGAELRDRYYQRRELELSYADAIHVAMAASVTECEALYSGDPDFEAIDEIETGVL
jgi:predicted nucleic acid-binding protein